MLNRSSRVMPGLRGTPAGMTTSAQPYSASGSFSGPVCALTWRSQNRHRVSTPLPVSAPPYPAGAARAALLVTSHALPGGPVPQVLACRMR